MAHVRIETSVPRHRKFLAAGPAASWLWLAGCCYCNEGLTDGHIPVAALVTLGVPKPHPLAAKLVQVGLWDAVADGWQIHDYLDHNRTATHVRAVRESRAAGGKLGGRPKPNLHGNLQGSVKVSQSETLPVNLGRTLPENPTSTTTSTTPPTAATPSTDAPFVSESDPPAFPFTVWLAEWHRAYPKARHVDARRIEREFTGCFYEHPDPPGLFRQMLAALEQHKRSGEWVRGVIPSMAKWLGEGWWNRELTPADESGGTSRAPGVRTGGNLSALQAFANAGKDVA